MTNYLDDAMSAYAHDGFQESAQTAALIDIALSLRAISNELATQPHPAPVANSLEAGMDVTGWHVLADHYKNQMENLKSLLEDVLGDIPKNITSPAIEVAREYVAYLEDEAEPQAAQPVTIAPADWVPGLVGSAPDDDSDMLF